MDDRLPTLPSRRELKQLLRQRLSARQTEALLRDGYKALVGAAKAEAEELKDQLEALRQRLG